ncbi:MAG: hypothetical protein ACHQ5A_12905, partial [Opitutales bacterium]
SSAVRHHVSAARGPTSPRDEANSRRLFSRWPAELTHAIAAAWARTPSVPPEDPGFASRLADGLFRAGLRRRPSARAGLLARSTVGREQARWQRLFDPATPATAPIAPGDATGFNFDTYYPQAWLHDTARFTLPAGFPNRNLFVNGYMHPETTARPESAGPLGLRITVNGVQVREVFPVPPGNFNFGFDSPASLSDEPTRVEVTLLGVQRTNRLGQLGRIIAGWPLPRRWRDGLGIYRPRELNRRLRLAQVVADDQVVCTFWNGIQSGPGDKL